MTTTEAATRERVDAGPRISGHQDSLDGIRAVAALGVLVFHVAADTGKTGGGGAAAWLLSGGAIGVPIFFTLSGLLLYRPWAAHALSAGPRPGTPRYLTKRALRILPAYWLVVGYVMVVIMPRHLVNPGTWLRLATLTYTYDPHPGWGNYLGPQGMGQMWSLTVEVAWYATLPLTAALLSWYARGDPARLLAAIAAYAGISFGYTIFMFHPAYEPVMGVWMPRFTAWFAIGMALAVVSVQATRDGKARRFCRTVAQSRAACWTAALLLYFMAATPLAGPSDFGTLDTLWTSEFRILLYGLVAAFFVAPVALASRDDTKILGNRTMRFLGRISYGVFLWQLAVSVTWYRHTGHIAFTGNFFTEFPVIAALTVAVATLSYYLVERPAFRLAHRTRRAAGPR